MPTFSSTNQPETRGAGGQKRHKLIKDALMLALEREVEVEGKLTRKIVAMADAVVNRAVSGDVSAFNAISDRIDGKPAQALVGGDGEGPVDVVARVIFKGLNDGGN